MGHCHDAEIKAMGSKEWANAPVRKKNDNSKTAMKWEGGGGLVKNMMVRANTHCPLTQRDFTSEKERLPIGQKQEG